MRKSLGNPPELSRLRIRSVPRFGKEHRHRDLTGHISSSEISGDQPAVRSLVGHAEARAGEPDDYHVARHLNGNFRFAEAKETPEAHGQAPPSGGAIRIRVKPASPDLDRTNFWSGENTLWALASVCPGNKDQA